ncbi:hypothetical protein H2248_010945 [Termitomyces sp. 'cryptogamus']|nr:hypothetical protein H2248_010945 [Termitomyces sp. 'cryptogamus']
MSSSSKRHRTSLSHDSSSSTETQHPTKSSRTISGQAESEGGNHPLLCTLPPTCNHKPTPLANSRELEAHYATYHAHVCEQHGCGAVFPEVRLLELHQTECHDPLAAVRKERGEKIFGCHLASCARLFSTPKTRRLHLIQAHGYPKEYFFAVTNKGIGGLLRKWGEGASMIRGEWKSREEKTGNEESGDEDIDKDDIGANIVDDTGDTDTNLHLGHDIHAGKDTRTTEHTKTDEVLDGLIDNMGSLSLIPPSIRFGRGGKGGFLPNSERGGLGGSGNNHNSGYRGRGRGGRGRGRGGTPHASTTMDIDTPVAPLTQTFPERFGRGRAGNIHRSRGRGGIRGATL